MTSSFRKGTSLRHVILAVPGMSCRVLMKTCRSAQSRTSLILSKGYAISTCVASAHSEGYLANVVRIRRLRPQRRGHHPVPGVELQGTTLDLVTGESISLKPRLDLDKTSDPHL